MPEYLYKAIDFSGKIFTSKGTYISEKDVIIYLKNRNLMPIEIKKINIINRNLSEFKIFKKLDIKTLSIFCKQFSVLLESEIKIELALNIIKNQTENSILKNILNNVYELIQEGNTFSEAMNEHKEIPLFMLIMIKVGETSENLNIAFKQLVKHYDKSIQIETKIKNSMTYPTIVMLLMSIVFILITTFIIPSYTSIFQEMDIELPQLTLSLISFSEFIINKWYLLLIIILICFSSSKLVLNYKNIRLYVDTIILKIPIIKRFIIKINTIKFSRTMAILLASNVSLINSLTITQKIITNTVIQNFILNLINHINQGGVLTEYINENKLFPYMLGSMVKIGEETKSLDIAFCKTADFYEEELNIEIEQLTILIEPIITIFIAIIMAILILAILMPTFSLTSQI